MPKITDQYELDQAIQEFKDKFGIITWEKLFVHFTDFSWSLQEKLKAMRESRDKWKKLSMCSRCHKIIEEKEEKTSLRGELAKRGQMTPVLDAQLREIEKEK